MKLIKLFFTLAALWIAGSMCYAVDNFTALSPEGKTVEYTPSGSVAYVAASSAINKAIEGELTIPDVVEYNGSTYTVTEIGQSAFQNNNKLTSVTIGNNVATIRDYAFNGCTNLLSVTFGTGLLRINKSAFQSSGLNGDLVFPSSLLYINESAFQSTNIKSVKLQSQPTIQSYAFDNCNSIEAYYFSPSALRPFIDSFGNSSYILSIGGNTKLYVSQAAFSMLQNNFGSGTLQNAFKNNSSAFVAYESTVGSVFMNQIDMANSEGTSAGLLSLCFTVTSTDETNRTAALYCPPSTGYSADDILKSGSNAVIKPK